MKKLGIRLLALTLLATVTTGCASSKQEIHGIKLKKERNRDWNRRNICSFLLS
ncbi:MAG: hypothetical protein ACLR43_05230 [Faecalibacillus faecis]